MPNTTFNGFGGFGGSTTSSGVAGQGQPVGGYSQGAPVSTGSTGSTGQTTNGFGTGTLNPALNTTGGFGQPGFGIGSYGTIPTQLVAGQFGGPIGVQGWNGPITGSTPNQFTGQPVGFGTQLVTGGYGQPIFQTSYPTSFAGFHAQGSHGTPSELRSAAGTTINVSQREAA